MSDIKSSSKEEMPEDCHESSRIFLMYRVLKACRITSVKTNKKSYATVNSSEHSWTHANTGHKIFMPEK